MATGTGGTSNVPTLNALCKELAKAETKWFKIGIHSGIPFDKVESFRKDDYPLASVFNYCLKGNVEPPLTWQSVVHTLKSEAVGEVSLAEEISKKYCQEESQKKDGGNRFPQQKLDVASGCYVFVNDSNLWIEGQKASAKVLKDAKIDKRYRVDLGRFVTLISKGRNILGAFLYGSKPPPNDTVWKAAREKNFKVELFQRTQSGHEKALNSAMTTEITKTIYSLDPHERDSVVFITVTGDRELKPPIDEALKNHIFVELWSWEDSMSREFRQLANTNDLFTAIALDGHKEAFSYTTWVSSKYRDINPAHAIVYRDVPRNKSVIYELADYLHQLLRLFFITPMDSQINGRQDLIVEFPYTKPEVIFTKLKTLGGYMYKPCSYPEYKRNCTQIRQPIQLTNRFEALGEIEDEEAAESLKLEESVNSETLSDKPNPEDEEDHDDWESALYKKPTLIARMRRRQDLPCKWGDHCAKGSDCHYKHTDEEKKLFASYPNVRLNYRKTRLCNKAAQHVTEQQRKRCIFAHTDDDSWCLKCAMYGHLTDNCKVQKSILP